MVRRGEAGGSTVSSRVFRRRDCVESIKGTERLCSSKYTEPGLCRCSTPSWRGRNGEDDSKESRKEDGGKPRREVAVDGGLLWDLEVFVQERRKFQRVEGGRGQPQVETKQAGGGGGGGGLLKLGRCYAYGIVAVQFVAM
ncbi:hypothetical protein CGRA01v4_08041 [Colletotrichum graminicola]|nr:hypothetical protein CGRA01v4_08041 [Colletotrichum graminicola]